MIKKAQDRLLNDINEAAKKLSENVEKFNIKLQSNVFIEIDNENIPIVKGLNKDLKLYCKLDLKLLRRILDRKAHWNNAEVGTHINFKRYPNKMDPDVHTCMSFFHL